MEVLQNIKKIENWNWYKSVKKLNGKLNITVVIITKIKEFNQIRGFKLTIINYKYIVSKAGIHYWRDHTMIFNQIMHSWIISSSQSGQYQHSHKSLIRPWLLHIFVCRLFHWTWLDYYPMWWPPKCNH